jgi:hypothetical protein
MSDSIKPDPQGYRKISLDREKEAARKQQAAFEKLFDLPYKEFLNLLALKEIHPGTEMFEQAVKIWSDHH